MDGNGTENLLIAGEASLHGDASADVLGSIAAIVNHMNSSQWMDEYYWKTERRLGL
jgi:hypothetical protein